MEQRDYLKKQIDQLTQVLIKMLANFLGLKSQGKLSQGIEAVSQALKKELDLDIDAVLAIPDKEFIEILLKKNLNADSLSAFADLLYIITGSMDNQKDKKNLSAKTLLIYQYLDKISSTYSFDRHIKTEKLMVFINE